MPNYCLIAEGIGPLDLSGCDRYLVDRYYPNLFGLYYYKIYILLFFKLAIIILFKKRYYIRLILYN